MSKTRVITPAEKQRLIRRSVTGEWTILVILWVALLANLLFDFDMLSFKRDPEGKTRITLIALTVGCTVFYAAWLAIRIRRNLALASRGVMATGFVTRMENRSKGTSSRIWYRYPHGEREYGGRAQMNFDDCKDLEIGSPLNLLVDPVKPSRSARYGELYPDAVGA